MGTHTAVPRAKCPHDRRAVPQGGRSTWNGDSRIGVARGGGRRASGGEGSPFRLMFGDPGGGWGAGGVCLGPRPTTHPLASEKVVAVD